jgi:glutamate--cysteine ligase
MTKLQSRLRDLSPETLKGMRRGIEKESLRAQIGGNLALTPHPAALGAALTHPHITTDFSESQLELITGVHPDVDSCIDELTEIHRFTQRAIGDELLWAGSMPCELPAEENIPIGAYGSSNIGRAKSVYRIGLGHRYSRHMQMISGIHYNWSLPGLSTADYFGLIRNFRRQSFLLLYLFGASPAVCSSFMCGRPHELSPLADDTLHLPDATSLRMGRLGYQSDAQAALAVSYNCLNSYATSLHDALTRPYPAYAALGIHNRDGEYNQLATSLLQIENEFYGTIRPKRVVFSGERPLHALRERGVEYVEVRCMDLNPFLPLGIDPATARFLDILLLHCLLKESPRDSPQEIAALARNQDLVASHGRAPGLMLERDGKEVSLATWGAEILDECRAIATALDALRGGQAHGTVLEEAFGALRDPRTLPSARVLATMASDFGNSHTRFTEAQSLKAKAALLETPLDKEREARFMDLARRSFAEQQAIEAADNVPFETFRENYLAVSSLGGNAKAT